MRSRPSLRNRGSPTLSRRSKPAGSLPITVDDEKVKRPRRFFKLMRKRWYKTDYAPLCAGFCALSELPLATKRRYYRKAIMGVSGSITILAILLVTTWLRLMIQEDLLSKPRSIPLQVRVEGLALSLVSSKSTKCLDFPVILPSFESPSSPFSHPRQLSPDQIVESLQPQYGIDIHFLEENVTRVIFHDVSGDSGQVRDYSVKDDDVESYYAYDDDVVRNVYATYDDDHMKKSGRCRRLHWHRYHFPNCNSFHEMDIGVNIPSLLGNGGYRDVFIHTHYWLHEAKQVIYKTLQWQAGDFTFDMFEFTRMDALVSERFSSNNRFVDIYGHCGNAILSELLTKGDVEKRAIPGRGYIHQADLHDENELRPQNNLTAKEKFQLALEMAESITLLHEYPEGKIVHDDIQLAQFLYNSDGSIKFNDFNRAEIMLWDEQSQDYCRYRNGNGHGNFRAPEEYSDKPLNEKIDVYSYGNNLFGLLTGLWPFYEYDGDHEEDMQKKEVRGDKTFLDPRYRNRSQEESILVDIIEACWAYNPDERPDMRSLATKLQLAKHELYGKA